MLRFDKNTRLGFTIVELLIVVVVIAILAAVTVVAYNGIATQAKEAAFKSELETVAKQVQLAKAKDGFYPASANDIKVANTTTLTYVPNNQASAFCVAVTSTQLPGKSFYLTDGGAITEGLCPGAIVDGSFLQVITDANCPSTRTRAVDARDGHTYWVQKLTDGKCWMLTNLAYAGGGAATYNDVRTLVNGTSSSATFTAARYYVVTGGTNFTLEPTPPSTSTNGTGQYGYLYNWCAAMGVQATTACGNASPTPNTAVTVCPAGWRLPTGGASGEFAALNTAVNGGSTAIDTGLRTTWLAQYSGSWFGGFGTSVGTHGVYWSGSSASSNSAYRMFYAPTTTSPDATDLSNRGFAVRCVAL